MLLFSDYISSNKAEFENKVISIANALGTHPDYLMFVMMFESNLNEKAINPGTGASGLFQLMPETAKSFNISIEDFRKLSNIEQLDYLYTYLKPYKGRLKTCIDAYFAIFFPAAIGKDDSYILQTSKLSSSKIASQNKIFDLNRDVKITVGEIKEYLNNWIQKKKLNFR